MQFLKNMTYFSKHANIQIHDIYKNYYQKFHELDTSSISKAFINEFVSRVNIITHLFLISLLFDLIVYIYNY